jgi:hypothetical protein
MIVPFLLPHLLKRICYIKGADFFIVLEFEEFGAAVTCHIYEYVTLLVCQ